MGMRDGKRTRSHIASPSFRIRDPNSSNLGPLVDSIVPALVKSRVTCEYYIRRFVSGTFEASYERAVALYIEIKVIPAAQSFLDYYYILTEQQWSLIWRNRYSPYWRELRKRILKLRSVWRQRRTIEQKYNIVVTKSRVSRPRKGYRHDRTIN